METKQRTDTKVARGSIESTTTYFESDTRITRKSVK